MIADGPAFNRPPAIFPFPRDNPSIYYAYDGNVLNGSAAGRRWLLSGKNLGVGTSIPAPASGVLVLEVTATGSGGTVISNSDSIQIGTGAMLPGFPGLIDPIFSQDITDDLFGGQIINDSTLN